VSEFEFLRSVTIGQYVPADSVFHRLDPRVKLVACTAFLIGTVITPSLAAVVLTLLAVLGATALAQIPLRYAARGLRPTFPFLVLLALLQVFAIPQNDIGRRLWQWWRIVVTTTDLRMGALTLLRFVTLMLGVSLFSHCTSVTEVTHGVEHLVRPLQRIGFPAHELALVIVIALRFVPLLALEAERIAKAQASRGADLGSGRVRSPFARARRMLPLLVPLFVTALHRAETLILAMEARCYTGGKGRTHLVRLQAHRRDAIALLVALLLTALLIATRGADIDAYLWYILW
jgi:energy-coupling factor transport system permease protein